MMEKSCGTCRHWQRKYDEYGREYERKCTNTKPGILFVKRNTDGSCDCYEPVKRCATCRYLTKRNVSENSVRYRCITNWQQVELTDGPCNEYEYIWED